jgi:steroid 3-oxidase
MQLKRRKTDMGETLQWTDYMSLSFTQHVSIPCHHFFF